MALNTIADLSTTAGSNVDVLGQNASGSGSANTIDTLFQNLMALIARAYGDIGGLGTVGGSANAITLTSKSTYQALENGLVLSFKAASANTGATTLNLDGLGAKAIRRQGDSALSANDIVANGRYIIQYDAAYNSAAGAWVLLNPSDYASGGADVPLADGGTGASLTDPGADRILFWDDSAGAMTWLSLGDGLSISGTVLSGGLTQGTAQSPTGVSSVDFTSIPSGTKRITISVSGLSASGTNSSIVLQLGDSGGIEATGYTCSRFDTTTTAVTADFATTTSFPLAGPMPTAADSLRMTIHLTLLDSATNTWCCSAVGAWRTSQIVTTGYKALSATLDRVRLSLDTNNFDAGTVNIQYQ